MSVRADPASAQRRGHRRRGDAADDFRLMADCAPVMIWVSGPDRKCVYVNRLWLEFTGRTLEQSIGDGWLEGLHADDRGRTLEAYGRAFELREAFELEHRARRHDGAWRRLLVKGVPLVIDGELGGFIGSSLDITDRMAAERAAAEAATLARDEFLGIVSHELRSPLNGIKTWTHVLQGHLRDAHPDVKRALAGIMIGVEQQVRLIEDLLDVTRAMGGNLRLLKQPMPLLPVVAEAVESLRAQAAQKELRLLTDYAVGDCEVDGDPQRLRQVFLNLLGNAVKFTPRGGSIAVCATCEGNMARVDIRDSGTGITREFLPYVFDPFRQADQRSDRRSQEGLGIGLALVQRLCALHGGYATCDSEGANRGSVFSVHLPLRAPAETSVVVERLSEPSTLPSLSGVRVLLIDDQREARESLATLLEQSGAAVATAASSQEALAHLAIADDSEQPQVIVCDIAMPGEDGYATLKRIRAWEATRAEVRGRCPAVALSAFDRREDRVKALAEGFQMHLTKPVSPAELTVVLSSVVNSARA